MGLSEYIQPNLEQSILPNPLNLIPKSIKSYFPSFSGTSADPSQDGERGSRAMEDRLAEEAMRREEAERVYLSYSWWILNEGWRDLAERVREATEDVFNG
jgi:peroxin-3